MASDNDSFLLQLSPPNPDDMNDEDVAFLQHVYSTPVRRRARSENGEEFYTFPDIDDDNIPFGLSDDDNVINEEFDIHQHGDENDGFSVDEHDVFMEQDINPIDENDDDDQEFEAEETMNRYEHHHHEQEYETDDVLGNNECDDFESNMAEPPSRSHSLNPPYISLVSPSTSPLQNQQRSLHPGAHSHSHQHSRSHSHSHRSSQPHAHPRSHSHRQSQPHLHQYSQPQSQTQFRTNLVPSHSSLFLIPEVVEKERIWCSQPAFNFDVNDNDRNRYNHHRNNVQSRSNNNNHRNNHNDQNRNIHQNRSNLHFNRNNHSQHRHNLNVINDDDLSENINRTQNRNDNNNGHNNLNENMDRNQNRNNINDVEMGNNENNNNLNEIREKNAMINKINSVLTEYKEAVSETKQRTKHYQKISEMAQTININYTESKQEMDELNNEENEIDELKEQINVIESNMNNNNIDDDNNIPYNAKMEYFINELKDGQTTIIMAQFMQGSCSDLLKNMKKQIEDTNISDIFKSELFDEENVKICVNPKYDILQAVWWGYENTNRHVFDNEMAVVADMVNGWDENKHSVIVLWSAPNMFRNTPQCSIRKFFDDMICMEVFIGAIWVEVKDE